jgi:hypothetical protein
MPEERVVEQQPAAARHRMTALSLSALISGEPRGQTVPNDDAAGTSIDLIASQRNMGGRAWPAGR